MTVPSSVPECLACGVCCHSTLPTYVRVSGDDFARLGDHADQVTTFIGNRCYLRIERGRCVALTIGDSGYPCSIYGQRPTACRSLERGSAECLGELVSKAARVHPEWPPPAA